jgi:hypothetical protein
MPVIELAPTAPPRESVAGQEPVEAQAVSRDLTPPAPIAVASIPVPKEVPAPIPAARTAPATELKLVEDPLVSAMRCYLNKRPDEALTYLKRYDKTTQELLLVLLPLVARLTEGGLQTSNPQEIKLVVEQMEDVTNNLRSRAPFRAEHMCFCSKVEKFGSYRKLSGDQVFHPGDPVQVYVEFKNFSSVFNGQDHCIRLISRLEIRDYSKRLSWREDFPNRDKPDYSRTPRHDFHKVYFFNIPHIPPGLYTLLLHVTDLPTGRSTEITADFQVGPSRNQ